MDFDDIEYKIKKENVKLFILCSPGITCRQGMDERRTLT